jgi:hypothetical protein
VCEARAHTGLALDSHTVILHHHHAPAELAKAKEDDK